MFTSPTILKNEFISGFYSLNIFAEIFIKQKVIFYATICMHFFLRKLSNIISVYLIKSRKFILRSIIN